MYHGKSRQSIRSSKQYRQYTCERNVPSDALHDRAHARVETHGCVAGGCRERKGIGSAGDMHNYPHLKVFVEYDVGRHVHNGTRVPVPSLMCPRNENLRGCGPISRPRATSSAREGYIGGRHAENAHIHLVGLVDRATLVCVCIVGSVKWGHAIIILSIGTWGPTVNRWVWDAE